MAYYNGKEILFSPSISMSIGVVKEYKETNIYNKGDIVSYGGKLYTPKADNVSGVLPTTEATWEELTSGKADKVELEQLQESVERDHNLLDERLANLESGKADKDDFETLQENVESDHNWLIEVDALSITANITSAELADKAIITDGRLADLEQKDIITNKRLANLESATLDFIEDSTIAYSKTVPENALPYAIVTKIGGMTRKCTNLIPFPYKDTTLTTNGITFTDNGDGTITANGTATNVAFFIISIQMALPSGTYFISDGCSSLGETAYVRCGNGIFRRSFTTDGSAVDIEIRVASGVTLNNVVFKPMLNKGDTALPYEPYFEGLRSAPVSELVSEGANLIPYPYADGMSKTMNGITFTVNNDGGITVNGTATGNAVFIIKGISGRYMKLSELLGVPEGQYTFSGTRMDGFYMDILSQVGANIVVGQTFNTENYSTQVFSSIRMVVVSGKTINNETVYPMLNKGSTALPYRPYFKRTLPIPEAVRPAHGINETVYDYIEWCEDGTRKKRVKCGVVVFDGTENWDKTRNSNENPCFTLALTVAKIPAALCWHFNFKMYPYIEPIGTTGIFGWESGYQIVYFASGHSTVEEWKAYLAEQYANGTPVTVIYALSTPEVTDISDILTADNWVEVQAYGSMTPVNEFGYAVPTTINYATDIGE